MNPSSRYDNFNALRRDPVLLEWTANAQVLDAVLEFPADGIWFAGHFPGFPVLPGVAQLFFVRKFARKAFGDFPDAGMYRRIKFMRPVRPGERVALTVARKGENAFAFSMSVGDAPASSGEIVKECGSEGALECGSEGALECGNDALLDLLPHRPPMRMLAGVLEVGDGVGRAIADTSQESVFHDSEAGGVPACVALEYMAQTVALAVGESRRSRGAPPRAGFLLGTRRMEVNVDAFASGRRYSTVAKCTYADDESGSFDCTVIGPGGELAARAALTAYQLSDGMLNSARSPH